MSAATWITGLGQRRRAPDSELDSDTHQQHGRRPDPKSKTGKMRAALRQHGAPMTSAQLAAVAGCQPGNVRGLLKADLRAGRVHFFEGAYTWEGRP